MGVLKIGGYVTILVGVVLALLSFVIPASRPELAIGAVACLVSGITDILVATYLFHV